MEKNGKTRLALALFFLFIFSHAAADTGSISVVDIDGADYVALSNLSRVYGLDSSFDIITQRGRFYRGTSTAVYQVGLSAALFNGALKKYPRPVLRKSGDVLFPAAFAEDLLHGFYPHWTVSRKDRLIIFSAAEPIPRETPQTQKNVPGEKAEVPPVRDRIGFIIIDAGHGGIDPGAIGRGGLQEKTITLSVAGRLESYLKSNLKGVRIMLTRRSDIFIELVTRTKIANGHLRENENGVFISIHVNASISPRISGFETYYLSQNPTNDEARATAALENNVVVLEDKSHRKSYDDIEHMEAFMLTAQIQRESALLAECIQSGMDHSISEFKSRGVRKADFFVLRGALMPAALAEIGYITNSREAQKLTKAAHQDKVARGIGRGLISFIKKYNQMIKN
ncbi:MAG TPA: N-acetylmuramoyl-L-alanine amidase [Spirochaetota bacterium]|nr:N-acetylmuramoyl-L-alanine amidase [Spirochaetota bacterium]